MVVVVTTHFEELPLEALIRLLEQGEENSPCHPVKAYPKLLPWTLGLEEVEEDVHRGSVPEVVTEDAKRPHEGLAVGMQLCKGHVDLRQ